MFPLILTVLHRDSSTLKPLSQRHSRGCYRGDQHMRHWGMRPELAPVELWASECSALWIWVGELGEFGLGFRVKGGGFRV